MRKYNFWLCTLMFSVFRLALQQHIRICSKWTSRSVTYAALQSRHLENMRSISTSVLSLRVPLFDENNIRIHSAKAMDIIVNRTPMTESFVSDKQSLKLKHWLISSSHWNILCRLTNFKGQEQWAVCWNQFSNSIHFYFDLHGSCYLRNCHLTWKGVNRGSLFPQSVCKCDH